MERNGKTSKLNISVSKYIAYLSLFTAIVIIATDFLAIPNGLGYNNLGDAFIFTAAYFFGGYFGFFVGGIGSAIADVILGYTIYAPFTLVIKGVMAFIVFAIVKCLGKVNKPLSKIVAFIAASVFMAVGYFATNAIIANNILVGFSDLLSDFLQGIISTSVAFLLTSALEKTPVFKNLLKSNYNTYDDKKKILCINDLSAVGNCSLTTAMAILPALNHEVIPFATAYLSAQTGYSNYIMKDLSSLSKDYFKHLKEIGVTVDFIFCGFSPSNETVETAAKIKSEISVPLLIDPVLGDGGKLYDCFDNSFVEKTKNAIKDADYITPNLTEACLLTDTDYNEIINSENFLERVLNLARKLPAENVIITGAAKDGIIYNVCKFSGGDFVFKTKQLPETYSGTGDVFASLFTGFLCKGYPPEKAAYKAAELTYEGVYFSFKNKRDKKSGLDIAYLLKKIK